MHTAQRFQRVRELMDSGADKLPFKIVGNSDLVDATGAMVLHTVRRCDVIGVHPSNPFNAELIAELTQIAAEFNDATPAPGLSPGHQLTDLQAEVHAFSDRLFPDRNPARAFLKLFEELGEVIKNPRDPLEWADVFILMLDLSKHYGVDIVSAVAEKCAVLESRAWLETETGTYQHVPKAE